MGTIEQCPGVAGLKESQMKIARLVVAGAVLAGLSGVAAARDNVHFSIAFGVPAPVVVAPAPVYAPAPAYYAPPPTYYPPAPTYYPQTVYYAPQPVYSPYVVRYVPSVVVHRPPYGRAWGHHWR
jgi:hypothetical protein